MQNSFFEEDSYQICLPELNLDVFELDESIFSTLTPLPVNSTENSLSIHNENLMDVELNEHAEVEILNISHTNDSTVAHQQ